MKRLTVVLVGGAIAASLAVGTLAAPPTVPRAAGDPHEYRTPPALLAQGDPHEYVGPSASLVEYTHLANGGTTEVCGFYNCGIGWL